MLESNEEIIFTVALSTGLILVFAILVVIAILKYRNKQKELLDRENTMKIELIQATLEAKEQTLEYLSEKLHIDVQQSLSLAKLNLNKYFLDPQNQVSKIEESKTLISQTINEIKDLSKELDPKYITGHTLEENIVRQLNRVEKKAEIATKFTASNIEININQEKQIIIYRIVQEAINNIIIHSEATSLEVELVTNPTYFILTITDNGKGFDTILTQVESEKKMGLGIHSMMNRTTLIGGSFQIKSESDKGTQIVLKIPYDE